MSEGHLRLVSLSILGGSLHGRRHNPDEVVAEILIGSDPGCQLVVDLPGISPIHAKVWADLNESTVYDTSAPRGVYVNAERVEHKAPIGERDVLWLGPPQEPDSVCIQCQFEPWIEVLPTVPVESYEEGDAVVIEGDPATTLAVTPDMIPSEAPSEAEPEAEVLAEAEEAQPVLAEPAGPAVAAPEPIAPEQAPTLVEPRPTPAVADDPFFVGEVAPSGLRSDSIAPEPVLGARQAAAVPPEPAPADDWMISEAAAVEPEPAAAPAAADFFVAEEPDAPAAQEPTFVEADPVGDVAPEASRPEASAAFLDLPPLEPAAPPPPAPPPPAPAPARPKATVAAARPASAPTAPAEPRSEPRALVAEPGAPAPAPRVEPSAAKPAAARPPQAAASRRPAGATPTSRAAPARRPAGARASTRAAAGGATWVRTVGFAAAGLVLAAALGFGVSRLFGGSIRLDAVEPARLRVGQRATLTGSGFGSEPAGQTVVFGDREARVLEASPKRLDVEVPEAVVAAGAEGRVAVVVRARGRTSGVVDVTVFQGPRLHGISPGAAMPGEEVMLAGAGWGIGATVQFGPVPARILEVQATQIRAIVPELAGGPGTQAPVVVTVGGADSNPAPFILGHLPVLTAIDPARAAPGDVVSVSGRGFEIDASRNDVRVGGVPALVIAASNDSLQMIVPRLGPGDAPRPVEVRVPGTTNVGQAVLQLKPPADVVDFRFIAEPFAAGPGQKHAVLATGLGPAFVLAASGGKTAAERAALAADRLNAAATALRTTLGLDLEARALDSSPVIGLSGRSDTLLEVTQEDAAAYNEDWTGLRGRGGPVTPARLARWWEALGRDLVRLMIRVEPPRHAAALAPEGRVLGQLFDAAQRSGAAGVPRTLVEEARPPLRDGLRLLGLRVPPSVTAPTTTAAAALPAAAVTPTPPPLQLDGTWGGSQLEQGQRQYLTVVSRGSGGSVAYEGGITFTVPMLSLEKPRRDQVRFSVQIRGGVRHYAGRWDGEAITGNVSTDAAGKNVVATFELRRR